MISNRSYFSYIYIAIIAACFLPFISPAIALLMGLLISILGIKNEKISKHASLALQLSIVMMGFGMNLIEVINASKTSFYATFISVISILFLGIMIGKLLKIDRNITLLISCGTAICGGSAIAAIAPIIKAKNHEISFSMIVIFILNGIALIIFPIIGQKFNLSEETFGYWAAIAIHDTSSVVGAGATYGVKALEIATIVKLTRALWIIPLALGIALLQKNNINGKVKPPWFIGLFILSIVIAYLFPQWESTYSFFHWVGKKGMVIALFLVGSSMSFHEIKKVGSKSFILGILLWILISVGSFIVLTSK